MDHSRFQSPRWAAQSKLARLRLQDTDAPQLVVPDGRLAQSWEGPCPLPSLATLVGIARPELAGWRDGRSFR
jgi:hypothetical protein